MQSAFNQEGVVKGIFISEVKNRFLCEVAIAGVRTLCYVPSSCRISNFIDLCGKEVLLLPTATPYAKTAFSLFAVPYKKNYIFLNSSLANSIIGQNLNSRRFFLLGKRKVVSAEYCVNGYKCDFFIHDTETIVEVKSIISTENVAVFPSVFSQRALDQLQGIKRHLEQGKPACYIITSLNPYIKAIALDKQTPFFSVFNKCISLGMITLGVSCKIKENQLAIHKMVEILF